MLTIKIPQQCHWHCSSVFTINLEHISFTPCSSVSIVNFKQVNAGRAWLLFESATISSCKVHWQYFLDHYENKAWIGRSSIYSYFSIL